MKINMIYILWSCRDNAEARTIIDALLEHRLIACASIFPEVESIYRWEGEIEKGSEVKVLLETLSHHFEPVQKTIQKMGSYKVPEIAQIDVAQVNPAYLSWLNACC